MNRFRQMLYAFMQGRRGMDQLNHFLIRVALCLLLVSIFVQKISILFILTYYGGLLILLWAYYRMFSHNLYKREMENTAFLTWRYRSGGNNPQTYYQNVDFEKYVYFKCPACGQKMRAPRKAGKIRIQCHSCGTGFEKKV